MAESTFSFGLFQKVNDAQPKRFIELTKKAVKNNSKPNTETNRTLIMSYFKYCRKGSLEK